jgi:hypothetical protein
LDPAARIAKGTGVTKLDLCSAAGKGTRDPTCAFCARATIENPTIDHPATSLGPRWTNAIRPFAIFFPKTESDLMPTTLARVRRLDCRGECLLVRVKLARGSTKTNGRV